ncbi:hypothetical protein, partial [Actinophytocola sediminis]
WHGPAAEAFRARLAATPRDLYASEQALRAAIAALTRWAGTLAAHQRLAEELDATAVRLRAGLRAAVDHVQDKQNALDLAATLATSTAASVELAEARGRVAGLERDLADVLARAHALERDHLLAAEETAAAMPGGEPPAQRSTQVRALVEVLDAASAMSTTLAAALAWPAAARPADP